MARKKKKKIVETVKHDELVLSKLRFPHNKMFWIQASILFVIAIALYLPTTNFDYVLDDKIVFTENNFVKKGFSGLSDIFSQESFTGYFGDQKDLVAGARYRPLSLASFAIEHQFWGINAKYSHWINIILYGILSVLVFYLLSLIFPKITNSWYSLVFISSLVFVLHPIHTEVVANIKGRDEILALLFGILSIIGYLKYLDTKKTLWLIGSLITFFLGILAKENVLPFLILIPMIGYFLNLANLKQIMKTSLWFVIIVLLYFLIRFNVVGYLLDSGKTINSLMNNPFLEMDLGEKMATISYTLLIYLKLLFYPYPLTHDYYPYHIPIMNWNMMRPWLSIFLNSIILWLAIRGLKKRKMYSYGMFFYLGTLFIVSNIPFSVGTFMNERFLFLPSFGWLICLVFILNEINIRFKQQYISYILTAVMIMGFAAISYQRIPAWKNGFELNKAAIKVSKNSARINVFMGVSYFNQYRDASTKEEKLVLLKKADTLFSNAIKIHPVYYDALKMKAGISAEYYKMNNNVDDLLVSFAQLAAVNPGIAYIHQYMDYLIKRDRSVDKLMDFVKRLGYNVLYKQKKNYPYALHYLNYGLQINPDIELYEMLIEVYDKMIANWSIKRNSKYNLNEIKQKAAFYKQKVRTLAQ